MLYSHGKIIVLTNSNSHLLTVRAGIGISRLAQHSVILAEDVARLARNLFT